MWAWDGRDLCEGISSLTGFLDEVFKVPRFTPSSGLSDSPTHDDPGLSALAKLHECMKSYRKETLQESKT